MVIVRARLLEQHQAPSYYDMVLHNYSRMLNITVKKWQTCHRVPGCWPHSTVCYLLGHGIGRLTIMVTEILVWYPRHVENIWCAISGAVATFPSGNGRDAIQDGVRKRKLCLRLIGEISRSTTAYEEYHMRCNLMQRKIYVLYFPVKKDKLVKSDLARTSTKYMGLSWYSNMESESKIFLANQIITIEVFIL